MTLTASNRPVFGNTWTLNVSNIEASSLIGLDIFGVSDPGIDNPVLHRHAGCGLRSTLDVTSAGLVTGPTHTYGFPVPSGQPSLTGLQPLHDLGHAAGDPAERVRLDDRERHEGHARPDLVR
jgi:hypothetical protein